jgi:hypothetical protein
MQPARASVFASLAMGDQLVLNVPMGHGRLVATSTLAHLVVATRTLPWLVHLVLLIVLVTLVLVELAARLALSVLTVLEALLMTASLVETSRLQQAPIQRVQLLAVSQCLSHADDDYMTAAVHVSCNCSAY